MKKDTRRSFLDPAVLARLSRLQLHARTLVEGSFSGRHKSPHRGSSVEFSQYRKYVPGDDVNGIDWRVYARSDRFYIKEFEADTNLRCYLVVDCSRSMAFGSDQGSKLEYARKLVGTLAHLLIKQSDAVGLHCFNDSVVHDIPPRTNAKHLHSIFEVLEQTEPHGETDMITILHNLAEKIKRRALVIVVSDFFKEPSELLDCFQHLIFRKHDLALFHLIDEAEHKFDFDRPTRFVDMETGAGFITDPVTIRSQYLNAYNSYLGELKKGCLEFGIDYRMVKTSEPYDEVLSRFLLERINRK